MALGFFASQLPEAERYVEVVRRVSESRGTIRPEAIGWLASNIHKMHLDGVGKIDLEIRKTGKLLDPEELRRLGLRAYTKVGHTYLSALTSKGLERPLTAIKDLVNESLSRITSRANLEGLSRAGCLASLLTDQELDRRCDAASALIGHALDPRHLDELPLPACSNPTECGCAWVAHFSDIQKPDVAPFRQAESQAMKQPSATTSLIARWFRR